MPSSSEIARLIDGARTRGETAEIADICRISMLTSEVLATLQALAPSVPGRVVEIGPYIGGSTIAMAKALDGRSPPIISIEGGGSHLTHVDLPTPDIIASLRRNLAAFGVVDRVRLIEGLSTSFSVRKQVADELKGERIGLAFIDADGEIVRDLALLAPHLAPDAILALDDYLMNETLTTASGEVFDKSVQIKREIDELKASGLVEEFCVVYEGTWFGRLTGDGARLSLQSRGRPFEHVGGFCYRIDLPDTAGEGDSSGTHYRRSTARLFEGSIELGPAHPEHAEIAEHGGGRFSHWYREGVERSSGAAYTDLYFSSSDNTDPNTNGRPYTLVVETGERMLLSPGRVGESSDHM